MKKEKKEEKEKMQRKEKRGVCKEKGITLVALVITIIILIILAGVTVSTLFGENGLIKMAQKAKDQYEEAAKNEEQQLAGVFGKNFADYNGQLSVTDGQLVNKYGEQIQLKGFVRYTIKQIF